MLTVSVEIEFWIGRHLHKKKNIEMVFQKIHIFIFLFILLHIKSSCSETKRVGCLMYENNTKCIISGITITSKNSTFVPIAPDSFIVVRFSIVKSIITVLTSNICETLPKIYQFFAVEQHIEIVEDYAFDKCSDIEEINLEGNNIYKLGAGIFASTKKLKTLHFLGASLDQIDDDLFSGLGELKQLMYSANGLKSLPASAMKNLKKLELLFIYSNELTDLDAATLVDILPNLKSIFINDNNFHCDRLGEILAVFQSRHIQTPDTSYWKHEKKRDYIPRKINKIICLTNAQLEKEKLKNALTAELDELKDLPLAKELIELKSLVKSGFQDSDSEIEKLIGKSENLTEKILNLNATIRHNSSEIGNFVNKLRDNINNIQKSIEKNSNDVSKKLRRLDEAIITLRNKQKENSSKFDEYGYNNMHDASVSITAIWVCLALLMAINGIIGVAIYRQFKRNRANLLSYEYRVAEHSLLPSN